MTRVVDRNGYATVYEYDANGNRTAVHYANGFTTTYEYDLLNRLICEKTVDSEDNVVVQYIYTLGAAGERKSVTELDRTVEYSYDSLYHLTSEIITEGEKVTSYTYAYDNVSNRILKTENGAETEYVYNALNQLVSDSETSYEYDLNGNLIRVIGSAQSALYEYNSENKLVRATVQNGVLVTEETYTYDYSGNRTSKTTHRSDGVTEYVKYLNDNSSLTNVLAEIDENGTAKCVYTIGADLVSQERDGRTSFYLYDGHGSVVGLANESGVVTDTYSYDAFGNLIESTGTTANNYRYCGEQFDETTGLYYLRARYMDTSTGRFISQDTYQGDINDPVSLHKYLYCSSNPVMNIDPSGHNDISLSSQMSCVMILGVFASTLLSPNYIKMFSDLIDGLYDAAYQALDWIGDEIYDISIQLANGEKSSADTNNEGKSGKNSKVNNPPSDSDNDKSKDDSKPRSKSRPARRIRCKSKKEAYERAKRAGKGAEPEHHPNDPHGPHYHPNVKNSQRTTPKGPCSHDHYFYPY